MKTIISIAALSLILFNSVTQQADYSQLRADAESRYSQSSYAQANEIYARVDKTKLAPSEARWVDFRLADTMWRVQAATESSDTTKFELAQKQREELVRTNDAETDRDLVWA